MHANLHRFVRSTAVRRLAIIPLALIIMLGISVGLTTLYTSHAQGDTTITLQGQITAINGNTFTVNGTTFEVTPSTTMTGYPTVGTTVTVIVVKHADGKMSALTIVIIITSGNPTMTATLAGTPPTATTSPSPTASVTPGGPTLTATSTEVESETPEATGSGTPAASPTASGSVTPGASPTAVPFITIIIEGPVEHVDLTINIIVVYGTQVKLDDNDPIRLKIKIGDWVRIKGHYDHDKDNKVMVVAIIIIIIDAPNTTIIINAPSGGNGNGGGGGDGKGKGHHHGDDD